MTLKGQSGDSLLLLPGDELVSIMATFVRSNHVKFSLKMPHRQASLFHTQFPSIFSKLSPPDPFLLPRASLFFKSLLSRPFISTRNKTVSSQINRASRLTMAQQHLELLMAGLPESETKHLDLRCRELGIADQEACSVVETRAFTNPEHRCTPEKVGGPSNPLARGPLRCV